MRLFSFENSKIKELDTNPLNLENDSILIVNPQELLGISTLFSFRTTVINEAISKSGISKFEAYDDYSFAVLELLKEENGILHFQETSFFMLKNLIIFIDHEIDKRNEKQLLSILEDDNLVVSKPSSSKILFLFLEPFIKKLATTTSNIESDLVKLEDMLIESKDVNFVYQKIISIRRRIYFLKKHSDAFFDVLETICENENESISKKHLHFFEILKNRSEKIASHLLNIRDYLDHVKDTYQSQLDSEMNRIMKIFTVVTSVFLPLSLIVGWYGMNFTYMPELPWKFGYVYVILLSIFTLFVCFFYFKKKRLI